MSVAKLRGGGVYVVVVYCSIDEDGSIYFERTTERVSGSEAECVCLQWRRAGC